MVSGDGTAPVDAVVDALVQQDGPTTALDAEAVARVRHELHRLPRWREALAAAGAAPQDTAARAALTGAVDEVLGLNSALAQSLRADDAARAGDRTPAQAPAPVAATSFEKAPPPVLDQPPTPAAAPVTAPPAPPAASPVAAPPVPGAVPGLPPGPPPPPGVAPGMPPAPPGPPTVPPGVPGYPPVPAVPLSPAELARRRRIALGVGGVVLTAGLVALGVHLFSGDAAPKLPGSVEGNAQRASSSDGGFPEWEHMRSSMVATGVQDPQAAAYGVVPELTADSEFGGDEHEARWTVVIGKSSPAFEQQMATMIHASSSKDAPHQVQSSLPGSLYCDSYDPDDSAKERARATITCLWADDEHLIVVEGIGVDEDLPAKVVERVHSNTEH